MKSIAVSVILLLFSTGALATTPETLEPTIKPEIAAWSNEDFTFAVTTRCRQDFDNGFMQTSCHDDFLFESTVMVNDQRTNSFFKGERVIKTTDVEFIVNGEVIWRSGDRHVYRPDWELVSAIEEAEGHVLTIRYPDGHIKDDWSSVFGSFANNRSGNKKPVNRYQSQSFALADFGEVVPTVYFYNKRLAEQGSMLINILLLIGYGLILAFFVYLFKYIKNKAVPASRARASEAVDRYRKHSHERKVRSETEALKIKEEAFRRYEAEKIKELIQDALEQDDHERAQELMAKLREAKTE